MNSNEFDTPALSSTVTTGEPEALISVRVGQLPGKIKTLQVPAQGCNVGSLLAAASLNASGYEIRIDNQPAKSETPVRNNQTVLLIRPVKGN